MFFSNVRLLRPYWVMGAKVVNSLWEHLIDFGPELSVSTDRLSPFGADQSASQGWLQVKAVKKNRSSFGNLPEEILPVLLAWALSKGQALHFGFHFWRHVSQVLLQRLTLPFSPNSIFRRGFSALTEFFAWIIWKKIENIRTIFCIR